MSLEIREKEKYEKIWTIPSYRVSSPGYICSRVFFEFFENRIQPDDTISDFGCGTGLAALTFLEHDLNIHLIDIAANCLQDKIEALTLLMPDRVRFTTACLWNLPKTIPPTDWIYCMDVLEHIPEEKIDQVLQEMAKRTKKGGVLQIFLQDEPFGDCIEETLHLTIKPQDWWISKIKEHWRVEGIAPIIEGYRFCCLVGPGINSR